MSAINVDERPTNVEPTETAPARKERSDKGKPRTRLTAEERAAKLNARAEVILADARAKAEARIRAQTEAMLAKAHGFLTLASVHIGSIDAERAGILSELAERVDGLELGPT